MAELNLNLLGTTNRIEVPFIKVTIGDYTFGVFGKLGKDKETKYPNYIKSLDITKINGQVNQYTLKLVYVIDELSDPNFFEKVFSSVSKTRKIVFSYGDMSVPTYSYKDEEAIMTDINSDINLSSNSITYTVSATSSCKLASLSNISYMPKRTVQPSVIIEELLNDTTKGLQEVFYGMKNGTSVNGVPLIPHTDKITTVEAKSNISVLDYIKYLVNEMIPSNSDSLIKGVYSLIVSDDTSGELQGPYFQIKEVTNKDENSDAYEIDVGTNSKDFIIGLSFTDNKLYSIYYDYENGLNPEPYAKRINYISGEEEDVYCPAISSGNPLYKTTDADRSWWSKVTSYPIKAQIKIKGLLRPAVLMTEVKLNVYFFGRKHISSGIYMVTKQQDSISEGGFRTTLDLVRVSAVNL